MLIIIIIAKKTRCWSSFVTVVVAEGRRAGRFDTIRAALRPPPPREAGQREQGEKRGVDRPRVSGDRRSAAHAVRRAERPLLAQLRHRAQVVGATHLRPRVRLAGHLLRSRAGRFNRQLHLRRLLQMVQRRRSELQDCGEPSANLCKFGYLLNLLSSNWTKCG